MAKHRRRGDLNNKPFEPTLSPAQKAREFDKQFDDNKAAGDAKERAGAYRPEPKQADRLGTTWGRKNK